MIYSKGDKLSLDQLGDALRSLGSNPSNEEVKKLVQALDLTESLTIEEFLTALQSDHNRPDNADEVRESFGVLDRDGSGLISASELKHVLMNMGERLESHEVDLILKKVPVDAEGLVRCDDLISIVSGY